MNTDRAEILKDKDNQNFNTALYIYQNNYSHEDLINLINCGSDVEKQIATLKIEEIKNAEEAQILVKNLTGCDGKIREAVSFRLKEFIPQNPKFYIGFYDKFMDAIIDINGNICRNTISAILSLKNYNDFSIPFCEKLTINTLNTIKLIKSFNEQDGKYKVNKELFKLYWYLETISLFFDKIDISILKEIIIQAKTINEYTIREKVAKILSQINNDEELLKIKLELKNDKNYYVRRF